MLQVELEKAYETIDQLRVNTQATEANAYEKLQKTQDIQSYQLKEAHNTIARLHEDLDVERLKSIQAINELKAIQMDLKKFRAMQSEVQVELGTPKPAVKPWYRLW